MPVNRKVSPPSEVNLAAYRERGWTITEHGHADADQTIGPCVRCHQPTKRYGKGGHPHCATCAK